jgi:hypothetical protein
MEAQENKSSKFSQVRPEGSEGAANVPRTVLKHLQRTADDEKTQIICLKTRRG